MSYLPYEPQQQSLLPQALQDGLPEGHLAYFVSDAIDSLDLRAFYAHYEGGGRWLAEPPNGWIKSVLGFRQFSMRGLHRVQAEWKLVCMALNLRRMATMQAA